MVDLSATQDGDWRVECNMNGRVTVVLFSGDDAERQAKLYVDLVVLGHK